MMLFPDRLAILVGYHHRIIDDNVKALGNATRIRAPWCSGLYDNPFHFVGHAMPKFEYSIGRRHLSLNDLVVAKRSIMRA